jgi:DNA-binding CsgD family transcriptional regulator
VSLDDRIKPSARARIVGGLADGRTDVELAADLGITVGTLQCYVGTLCRQHQVPYRAALIPLAFQRGWLPVAEDVPLPRPAGPLGLVLVYIAAGRTMREIGRNTGCSEATARRHAKAVRAHYGARTRTHAVALAIRSRHLAPHSVFGPIPISPFTDLGRTA